MKITPSYLYLSLLLCLLSYAPLDAQEAFNDSVALIKRNYINATVGKDKGKEVLLRQLSTIPPEKEASDQNVIELQQLYPISPREIKHLINTLYTDGSWEDINYADTKRSGWEPKKIHQKMNAMEQVLTAGMSQEQVLTLAGLLERALQNVGKENP